MIFYVTDLSDTTVLVTFTEAVAETSAEVSGKYAIAGLEVLRRRDLAASRSDQVLLTVSAMSPASTRSSSTAWPISTATSRRSTPSTSPSSRTTSPLDTTRAGRPRGEDAQGRAPPHHQEPHRVQLRLRLDGLPDHRRHALTARCGTYTPTSPAERRPTSTRSVSIRAASGRQEGEGYTREHSWPKSWFGGEVTPMYSDLFALYPTDAHVNGNRGNYPLGEVASPEWTSLNGGERGPCSYPGYSGIVFEPIDEFKGDLARTYFYMSTRYYTEDASWPGSPMTDGAELLPWAAEMLLEWHTEDPVSQKEIDRNGAIYGLPAQSQSVHRPAGVRPADAGGGRGRGR